MKQATLFPYIPESSKLPRSLPRKPHLQVVKKCYICKKIKPREEFYKDSSKYDGKSSRCKVCCKARPGMEALKRGITKKHHKAAKLFKNAVKLQRGCFFCGYLATAEGLEFHHVTGEKERMVSRSLTIPSLLKEMAKCIVVCANCHREIHAGVKHWQPELGGLCDYLDPCPQHDPSLPSLETYPPREGLPPVAVYTPGGHGRSQFLVESTTMEVK